MRVDELAAHGVDAPIGLGLDAETFDVAGGLDSLADGLLRLYGVCTEAQQTKQMAVRPDATNRVTVASIANPTKFSNVQSLNGFLMISP